MHFFRTCVPIFLACLAFSLSSSNAPAANARSGQFTRIMLSWLKRPANVDHHNVFPRGSRTLHRFRGVNDVRLGRFFTEDLAGLEQSLDVGAVVIFRDRGALEKFEHNPRRKALDGLLQPLVCQYAIYNLANE